ncbi:MAG: hypothetical protein JNJ75_09030 [Cyclobacteriaceae bacterium]|nr:hypothetical protein [Cyclobacteriaceae bacterium]
MKWASTEPAMAEARKKQEEEKGSEKKSRLTRVLDKKDARDAKRGEVSSINTLSLGSSYGLFSYTQSEKPNIVQNFSGKSFNVSINLEGNIAPVPAGATANVFGSYSYQVNAPSTSVKSFGYMYSGEAGVDDLMDYHVENEKDFNPRDVFLGIPFNDSDNFMVTGEGIGGGFRMYNKSIGHFGPRQSGSHVDIYNVGGEIGSGWTFGPGADLGKGTTDLNVSDWNRQLTSFNKITDAIDEPLFFRFNNDLGGEWGTNHNDKPFRATIDSNPFNGITPMLPASVASININNERSGRSSYIGYHTNEQMLSGASPSNESFSKVDAYNFLSDRSNPVRKDLIGEITIFNETGTQYNYGLPTYNRNEKNLSFSAKDLTPVSNFIAYTTTPNEEVKIGQVKNAEYASTYLLTEILTSEYVDVGVVNAKGELGSSPDDLGGYTRFNYEKQTDSYVWRSPYQGLFFNKNSQSDQRDNTGSYAEGEKEVYFVKSIETKTHVALFTTADRTDGMEAESDKFSNAQPVFASLDASKKLTRIDLYSIDDFEVELETGNLKRYSAADGPDFAKFSGTPKLKLNAKPIKTVHFEYSNELMTGLPNSSTNGGKLTLTRVYFEYNGISKTKISPYEFIYKYPDYSKYPTKYTDGLLEPDLGANYRDLTAQDQNPVYSYFISDGWGNYQKNGHLRFEHSRTWNDQNLEGNVNHFDPAAWQLKVIKLPSGGEIHVQYEQDDYSYVQDQEAHVMASLKDKPAGDLFTIDLASIGFKAGAPVEDFDQLKAMIDKRYKNKKIYFKMLYRLVSEDLSANPDYRETCNAEYIVGYASYKSCSYNTGNLTLTIQLESTGNNRLPVEICQEYVKTNRLGKIDPSSCNPAGMSDPDSPMAIANQFTSLAKNIVAPSLCTNIDFNHSYFRIPTPYAKKGGGLRVKRLMMYDKGLDAGSGLGEKVLYGSEYIYKIKEGNRVISSGVATNEPQSFREENILVDFVARKNQNLWSKIIAGKDKDQAEGPIGETVLPGPSVGYSRVIIKNIHSGKSNPGFSIQEFYTAKDYPVLMAHPDKAGTMTTLLKKDSPPEVLPLPFYSVVKNKTRATQGFSYILNNMHSQPKRSGTYSGNYTDAVDPDGVKITLATYTYYEPGEKIPVMSSMLSGISMKNPGREVDLSFSQRKVIEKSNDLNVEVDLQLTFIPLAFLTLVIPYPTSVPSFSVVEGELYTHSTTKVVRYPAILKKTEVYENGMTHTEENLAFNEYTGKPVSIRSTDEFKGAYLQQSIPASWEYAGMGPKWKNQDKLINGSFTLVNGYISLTSAGGCSLADFTLGDKIRLGDSQSQAVYFVTELDWLNNKLKIELASNGTAASGTYTKLNIIRTGKTNQLRVNAGSITSHNEVKDNIAPITIDAGTRYAGNENNLINDLNAWRNSGSLPASGTFTLSNCYSDVNMTGFADKLPGCNIDLSKAKVRQLEYRFTVVGNQVNLELMAFYINCANSNCDPFPSSDWVRVAAVGW